MTVDVVGVVARSHIKFWDIMGLACRHSYFYTCHDTGTQSNPMNNSF